MAVGRPTLMTPATVRKLEEAFLMGATDLEACLFAGIGRRTLYDYQEANPEYPHRKEELKQNPFMLAKGVQHQDLLDKNSNIAQKVLDRKEGTKLAIAGDVKVITEIRHTVVGT
jgi:hypothetical protein